MNKDNLSKEINEEGTSTWGCRDGWLDVEFVKEFIKEIEKICSDARMYADMDEPEFWKTSTINQFEAETRARFFEEFMRQIKELAGDKLI